MADATYTPKVYRAQGGEQLVVASGGSVKVESGGKILPNSGTQASAIATFTATGTFSTGIAAKINSLITACKNVGILATG